MTKGTNLGEFECLVLLAVLRMGEEAYGMTVRRELQETAGREAGIGSVYQTLERLELKGFLTSHTSAPAPERGGKPRRFFAATLAGRRAAMAMRTAFVRMWDGIDLTDERV